MHIDLFLKEAPVKYDKGQQEHGGVITDRNMLQEQKPEVIDLWFYVTAELVQKLPEAMRPKDAESIKQWAIARFKRLAEKMKTPKASLSEFTYKEILVYNMWAAL